MTVGQDQDLSSDGSASPQSSPRPQGMKVRDPRWLQVQVCHDFLRTKQCTRLDHECHFAHPPPSCIVENGRVTACFDAMKGRCQRETCKYFHPPKQIKTHLETLGRNYQQPRFPTFHKVPYNPAQYVDAVPNLTLGHWIPNWQNPEQLPVEPTSPRSPNLPRRLDKSDKLEICSEFMKNMCPHNESICPFAHPPPNIIPGDDGYVTVCMDYMKSECQRICCRYFHPPPHLQARVKAAQRRPPHFFGPFMPRGIPPIMQAPSQEMMCASPMPFPPQRIPGMQFPVTSAGPMPPLIPVPPVPEMYFPVGSDCQCMMPMQMPPVQAFMWSTGESVMMPMPPPEGFRQIPGQFMGQYIETMTPPATP
eukprot:Seg1393.10 transcript_id=Seg1393.10/GoldUCD/mRNA.D3Y31 product="Muscleblind-like protein 2a" protein_id=Seg1393.10/GoldUCD/D3Y31